MTNSHLRLRMFAGPHGSGKSTITSVIPTKLLGIYVNPDEIEKKVHKQQFLDLKHYGICSTSQDLLEFFSQSSLLEREGLLAQARYLFLKDNKLYYHGVEVNAFYASVTADYIRHKLIEAERTFTIETVMASPEKIKVLKKAQESGYKTYLYYIATEDPEINISRVRYREKMGGLFVPVDKIVERYALSLDLLYDAVKYVHRAYIFDNSGHQHICLAKVREGKEMEMMVDKVPAWFKKALWDKIPHHHS
ncbi:MAG: zeta toxin family protein [Parachlamydiales bacterium]|jgi:predicted ABC-type ATPase